MRRSISAIASAIWARRLPLELRAREAQRLEGVHFFRIANGLRERLLPFPLQLFHALLNARISVDESLAGITHGHIIR